MQRGGGLNGVGGDEDAPIVLSKDVLRQLESRRVDMKCARAPEHAADFMMLAYFHDP